MKKKISLIMALVLLVGLVGVTLAWLTDETNPVVNTFTSGNIDIELAEEAGSNNDYKFKMLPGHTITKDPKVTVKANSEKAWVFIKIEKSENYGTFLEDYVVADGWTALTGEHVVFSRTVDAKDVDQVFKVLKDDKVVVKDTVKKEDMDKLNENTYPTLTFTAYAHQYNKDATSTFTAEQAWDSLNPTTP